MVTTINERFNLLIEALKLNPNAFAKSIGKSYTAIDSTIKGKSKPGYDMLEATFETYPDISPDWLMNGKGEMYRQQENSKPKQQDDYLLDLLRKMEEGFSRLSNQVEVKDQQIASLQRMLEATLLPGKPNDVASDRSGHRTHPAVGRLFALRQQVA